MCEIDDMVGLDNLESTDCIDKTPLGCSSDTLLRSNEPMATESPLVDSGVDTMIDFSSQKGDAGASHTISFGANLDVDKYNELARRKAEANTVLKETSSDTEFLEAFKRREDAQKEMNEMLSNSDEFKNWSDTIDRKIDACLDPLRRNGIL